MIFLTGRVATGDELTFTHQVIDHQALLRPIVKASFQAEPKSAAAMIEKALLIAREGRPGPVHIDIPVDVAPAPAASRTARAPLAPLSVPSDDEAWREARAAFAAATRPIMIVGLDVANERSSPVVDHFAHRFGIPVITTYKAKGVVPEYRDYALGGAGLSPKADKVLLPLIAASDLVILVGYDPIEMRVGWRDPWPADHPVIEFSAVLGTHGMHQTRWSFIGSVTASLEDLGETVDPKPLWPDGEPAAARAALKAAFASSGAWGPAEVFATVARVAPPFRVATADSGAHRILLSQMWSCDEPESLLQSSGFCTMGGAVPLAIGYKLAAPDRPVIAFVGDAGLEMGLGELATARDLGLPIIVIVLVDRALALIDLKQRAMGLASVGVEFGRTDFAAVAEALGGHGASVSDRAGLEAATKAALAADRFTVIACELPDRPYEGAF